MSSAVNRIFRRWASSTSLNRTTSKISSPLLILPPQDSSKSRKMGGNSTYKFYSPAENKVLSFTAGKCPSSDPFRLTEGSMYFGSSHGWLVSFNQHNLDLFLTNPFTNRRIKLPPINTLPILELNLRGGFGCVEKIVISGSPDDQQQHCRAMLSYGHMNRLAFCCPGHSSHWTPVGDKYFYNDFVFCDSRQLFFCTRQYRGNRDSLEAWDLQDSTDNRNSLEAWDLRDPQCPKMTLLIDDVYKEETYTDLEEKERLHQCACVWEYLAAVPKNDGSGQDLLLLDRTIPSCVGHDGSIIYEEELWEYLESNGHSSEYELPHMTTRFHVHKYDFEAKSFKYIDHGGTLDGLSIFVGASNHAFALRASDYPGLKPDSIYFTDHYVQPYRLPCGEEGTYKHYGHDVGVYNYQDGTVSPCYYTRDVKSLKTIQPYPLWFMKQ